MSNRDSGTEFYSETFPTASDIANMFFVSIESAEDMLAENKATGSTFEREIAIGPFTHTVYLDSNGLTARYTD